MGAGGVQRRVCFSPYALPFLGLSLMLVPMYLAIPLLYSYRSAKFAYILLDLHCSEKKVKLSP
jgi:hypothetical protein